MKATQTVNSKRNSGLGKLVLGILTSCMLVNSAFSGEPTEKTGKTGIYDSRAIAVAYGGSDLFKKKMDAIKAEYGKAKTSGNKDRMAEIEKQMREYQGLLHKQGFSTAPVDDILKQIEDRLPQIKKEAGVDELISKWDKTAPTNQNSVVDVTMRLVDEFRPGDQQRKWAIDIQKHKPISIEQAEQIKD